MMVQARISNELGWNKTFNLVKTEKIKKMEVVIFAGKSPPVSSTISHANTIVSAPNKAGKNLIQNNPLPNK